VSAEVINISRVIKLSLSSHDILPPRDLSCSFFFSLKSPGKRTGGLLHWWTSPVFVVCSLFQTVSASWLVLSQRSVLRKWQNKRLL